LSGREEVALIVHELTEDDNVDFDVLARTLALLFAEHPPTGTSVGLERVTRAIAFLLGCRRATAEQLVTALLFRSQLVLHVDSSGQASWRFRRAPALC
jgi:hypothetical protein